MSVSYKMKQNAFRCPEKVMTVKGNGLCTFNAFCSGNIIKGQGKIVDHLANQSIKIYKNTCSSSSPTHYLGLKHPFLRRTISPHQNKRE